MHTSILLRQWNCLAVLCTVWLGITCLPAEAREDVSWHGTQKRITDLVLTEEANYVELVQNAINKQPSNAQDAMFNVGVLIRMGMNKEAIEALQELKKLHPQMDSHQIAVFYYYACDRVLAWDVAKATVEIFADNVSQLTLGNRLLRHFAESGWAVEDIDEWLAGMPRGIDGFWAKQRLAFNRQHNRSEAFVRELSDQVRKNPQDINGAITFLDTIIAARYRGNETWDLSWMGDVIKPRLTTQAQSMASRLKTLTEWSTAIIFFKQAIDTPFTEKEARALGSGMQSAMAANKLLAMFEANAREDMAACLLELGKPNQSQKWMVEAADIREKHHLGLNARFAGMTQARSGQRTIEGRIREKETVSKDDPKYWRQRAQYYRGSDEPTKEEEALVKGLALTTPQPAPQHRYKGHVDRRSSLLGDYARFLIRENRANEAVTLLRNEMHQWPATCESTKTAAHILAYDLDKLIRLDDEVLWQWLLHRPAWEHPEERLLWRMLEKATRDNYDKYLTLAEEAALGKNHSRAHALGWIMNRMHFARRSIPLLEYAVQNTEDRQLRERAMFALFESYLDTADWKQAEEVFPEAAKRLTQNELPDWHLRIAVLAANKGAKTDAMRIWRQVSNLCPAYLKGLDGLASSGLREELEAFYREMLKTFPTSNIPARAFKILTGTPLTPQEMPNNWPLRIRPTRSSRPISPGR